MPRLIDADTFKSYIDCGHLRSPIELCWSEIDVVRMIDKQPTIDAVPVVRCKECRHRQDPHECYMCFTEVVDIDGGKMYKFTDLTQPDGYCHRGAKMDGGAQ